ncbi:hypothetical protein IV203_034745 [Nitzschia inconspicua]|uniref:Uncharacterized protein n=1 Tax=Nitzschia inconspicua TaxID=303405 RepID=A0A9K3LCP8_9STRA|nr:hypothetical protein IV203_034745 [Nitzschia inconspicua]
MEFQSWEHATAGEGMRLTLEKNSFQIPISRSIDLAKLQSLLDIPPDFLEHEPPHKREQIAKMWRDQVLLKMKELIQARKSLLMNKHMRKAVFRSGMEALMSRFNYITENTKVQFREQIKDNDSRNYYLEFFRLSPIPDNVRNAPSCAAEIPESVSWAQPVGYYTTESLVIGEIVDENGRSLLQSSEPSWRPRTDAYIPSVDTSIPIVVAAATVEAIPVTVNSDCYSIVVEASATCDV